jgi:hypothetical protein
MNEDDQVTMSIDVSRIDITELTGLLEDRKNNDQKIALLLGSRTGALFRSQSFVEEMAPHSTSTRSFVDGNERERFSECYALLKTAKKQIDRRDLEILLNQKIRNIDFSMADDCLAELVEQKVFKLILSANPDELLYDAFTTLGLKENHDFVDFDLGRLSIVDTVDEILFHEKISACKMIKFYNDVDTFVHSLDKPQIQEEISLCVKSLLDRMRIKEVLIVGLDLSWDSLILSALPSRVKTVWFVNEDEHVKDTFRTTYEGIEQFRFITGGQGGYEKFVKALYWQINPGIPPRRYELTSRLQNKLNVMHHDLTSIKDVLKKLHEEVTHMQRQITKLSHRVEEAIKHERSERE